MHAQLLQKDGDIIAEFPMVAFEKVFEKDQVGFWSNLIIPGMGNVRVYKILENFVFTHFDSGIKIVIKQGYLVRVVE